MKTDLLAKLLASENIDIVRSGVSTASFDIANRVLTLPAWQDMTETIETMLKAHEIGHALFSPIELLQGDSKTPKSYINIIEDVRIERKIKLVFPGLRKDFVQGYKELNDRDFFKVANKDVSKMNLINRINLHFKASTSCHVSFSKAEQVFVDRTKTCDTVQDVLTLADDIYTFSKGDYEDKKQEREQQQRESSEEEEVMGDEYEDEYEDDDEAEEGESEEESESESDDQGAGDDEEEQEKEEEEEALEASTQTAFDSNLNQLANTNLLIVNHVTDIPSDFQNPIVGFKTVLADLSPAYEDAKRNRWCNAEQHDAKKFKAGSLKYVDNLVKEFEMKKSARRYVRTSLSKTGSLNVNKLYAHSISDNLFKSISVTTDEKNHGMIFLLDWSGSMQNMMNDTLRQVINLASFCQRAGIAYQVLAFSSTCDKHRVNSERLNDSILSSKFNLLELFSNKMTTSQFNQMLTILLANPWRYEVNYRLGNTPLNSSLLYMMTYIGKFLRSNNVEKASLVVLTDGVSNGLTVERDWNREQIHKIRDTTSKKDYAFPLEPDAQTDLLIKMIKDRYNIPVLGFYVSGTTRREVCNFIHTYMGQDYTLHPAIQSEVKRTGAFTLLTTAYDELYYIQSTKQEVEVELSIKSNASAAGMARDFGKFLKQGKKKNTVVNKFILRIA
jgi:Mg-chelatase subunit ChlD